VTPDEPCSSRFPGAHSLTDASATGDKWHPVLCPEQRAYHRPVMDITLFHKVILDHGRRAREPSPNPRYRPVSAINEFAGTVGGPWESRG